MINQAYRNMAGVCLVCGNELPKHREKYCNRRCQGIGRTKLTQLQIRAIRGVCRANIKRTGNPCYKDVARQFGCTARTVFYYAHQESTRKQRKQQALSALRVDQARDELKREIAAAVALKPAAPLYRDADILTGRLPGDHSW